MRRRLKKFVERLAGVRILRDVPGGMSLGADLAQWLPKLDVKVVFDVGANTGQSARAFASDFPSATIHSFEPGKAIFDQLVANVGQHPRVRCHQIAFGSAAGEHDFVVHKVLSHLAKAGEAPSGHPVEKVRVALLSEFCRQHAIERIGFLKIDTEGHDLEVLRGADEMLRDGRIDLVQVEAGMNPRNELHVPMERFKSFLEERGYLLFGIYEQKHEWSGEPQLRRADLTFLSPRIWQSPEMRWR
ncbi:FkbM family methyltransferase [Arenibaculum sp.]|jgi:FkbM family methyltransferase|uniref:FkbM family methyltransferase n=1 Tax=Arenibaculum sp. TaxID=2865862 RepID=UPI002E12AB65|nr:FkbM family methyltransferase [Arenibaculum sp.]